MVLANVCNLALNELRRANPFDKFQLRLRQLIENRMAERMAANNRIVTHYMDDKEFCNAAFAVLSKVVYESIPEVVPPGAKSVSG